MAKAFKLENSIVICGGHHVEELWGREREREHTRPGVRGQINEPVKSRRNSSVPEQNTGSRPQTTAQLLLLDLDYI